MNFLREAEIIVGSSTNAVSIKDLRIVFEVQKSLLSYPNKSKVTVYNLNESTRNQIKNEFTKIIINAGYKGNVGLVFTGDIKNVAHTIDGVDTITEIYAGDADNAWINSSVNFSSSSSQSLKDTVINIVNTMPDVTIGNLMGLDQGKISDKTITLSGTSRESLNNLANTYNFSWSIQNGVFETTVRNKALTSQASATVISAKTGMVGSPTITEIGADVNVFFNPFLLPNRYIKIESSGLNINLGDAYFKVQNKKTIAEGYYIINELTHNFDNRGGDALTKIKSKSSED